MIKALSSVKVYLGLLIVVALAAGCAPTQPEKTMRYFWPMPPDTPRVEFIKNYYNKNDLPKSAFGQMMNQAIGGEYYYPLNMPISIASNSKDVVYVSDGLSGIKYFDFVNSESKYVDFDFVIMIFLEKVPNIIECE